MSLENIILNISFFDSNGKLIDVFDNKWLSNISVLQPNESVNFSISRSLASGNVTEQEIQGRKSTSVIITLSSAKEFKA
jgi:hypothetical protein